MRTVQPLAATAAAAAAAPAPAGRTHLPPGVRPRPAPSARSLSASRTHAPCARDYCSLWVTAQLPPAPWDPGKVPGPIYK